MARKLKPGVHNVRIKGQGMRRVRVNAKGQWKFLKSKKKKSSNPSRKKSKKRNPSKKRTYRRSAKKVYKTAKGKFFKNLGMVGFAEDLAWGYVGMSLLGANASGLATARVIQGIQGHALGRRGKQRLIYGLIDLIDLWLIGQYKLPKFNVPLLEAWK